VIHNRGKVVSFSRIRSFTDGMGKLTVGKSLSAPLSQWESWMRAASMTTGTVELRTYHLRRLAAEHPGREPFDLGEGELTAWLGDNRWSRSTRRAYRASIRPFYRWATEQGSTEADLMLQAEEG